MWIIVGCYLLIFIVATVCVIVAARAGHTRTEPAELAESTSTSTSLFPEDWETVRREQCLPTDCPRATGYPRQPRRDAVCEACASAFLERRWRLLMGEHPESTDAPASGTPPRLATPSRDTGRELLTRIPLSDPVLQEQPQLPAGSPREARRSVACFFAGAVLALTGGLLIFYSKAAWALPAGSVAILAAVLLLAASRLGAR